MARYFDLPRKDTAAAIDVVIGGKERIVDLARIGSTYFVTVLAAGFDAIVNERANQMTWPKGQMRYNLATVAELRTLKPISYVVDFDGEQERFEATLVAVGNGPSFGGGLRITEGAVLDDGLLDVVWFRPLSRRELLKSYPKLFKGTHVNHPDYRHRHARKVTIAAPGITAYADGERIGALPLTVEVAPLALRVLVPVGVSMTEPSPAERYARSRRQPGAPAAGRLRLAPRLPARRLPGARLPRARGRHARCSSRRRRARARRSSASSPCTSPCRPGRKAFYTTPIKALSNQKFNDLVRRYGADKVGLLTGDNSINGEAPVVVMTTEVLRNMLYAGSRTLAGLGLRGDGRGALPRRPDARRGLGGGDHPPPGVGGAGLALARRSATPRSSASGWAPCAARPRRSSRSAARCRSTST